MSIAGRMEKSYLDDYEEVEQKRGSVYMGWLYSALPAVELVQMITRSKFAVQAQLMEGLKSRLTAVARRKTKRVASQAED